MPTCSIGSGNVSWRRTYRAHSTNPAAMSPAVTAMLSEEAKVDSPYSTQTSPTVDRTTESLSKGARAKLP